MREGVPEVRAALDEWLDDLTLGGQASTARTYRSLTKRLEDWPDQPMCRQLVGEVMRTRSRSTARTLWAALSAFCTWSRDQGYCAVSPMQNVPCPRPERRHHTYPTVDELRRVYASCRDDRERVIVRLLLHGLRAGQLLAIRWSDLRGDQLLIREHKRNRPHLVVIDAGTLRLLETLEWPIAGSYSTVQRLMARLGKDARVPGFHAHSLRHAWASHASIAGVDALDLQTLGGWSSAQMVAYYTAAAREQGALQRSRALSLTERLLDL